MKCYGRGWLLFLAGALVISGCGSVTGVARWDRVIGVIEIGGGMPAPIQLPAEIRAGVPFEATVTTWGSGSCTRADGALVTALENGWEVTPFDREKVGRGVVCTDDLHPYPRTVVLRIDEAGEAVIRVRGRTNYPPLPAHYEARVDVRP